MHYVAALLVVLVTTGCWLAHLVYTWTYDLLGLFIMGLVFPPIGIIHGAYVLVTAL